MDAVQARELVVQALDDVLGMSDHPSLRGLLHGTNGDASLEQLGLDSLGLVELSLKISDRIGADIEAEDLSAAKTLSGVVALIVRQAGNGAR